MRARNILSMTFLTALLILPQFDCQNTGYKLYPHVKLRPTSRRGSLASKQTIEGLLYEIWDSGFIRKNELIRQEILNNAYGIFRKAPKAMSDPVGRALYHKREGTKDLLLLNARLFGHLEPAPIPRRLYNVRVKRLDTMIRATLAHELFHDFWHNILDERKRFLFTRDIEIFFIDLMLTTTEKEKQHFLRELGSAQQNDPVFNSFEVLLEIQDLYAEEKWGGEAYATIAGRAFSGKTFIPAHLRKYYSYLIPADILHRDRILSPPRAEKIEETRIGTSPDDFEALKLSLNENPILSNRKDKNGFPPLHRAIYAKNLDAAQLLLQKGADINSRERTCAWTPLLLAAHSGQKDIVQWLIDRGTDMRGKDTMGRSPVHIAARGGHEELMELLLKHGGEIHAKDAVGMTPLHWAALNGRSDTVSFLISREANSKEPDFAGQTPLHLAAFCGNKKSTELLIAKGAELDRKDNRKETALHIAASCGNEQIVELLLAAGADREVQNIDGATPADLASKAGNEKIAGMLLAGY